MTKNLYHRISLWKNQGFYLHILVPQHHVLKEEYKRCVSNLLLRLNKLKLMKEGSTRYRIYSNVKHLSRWKLWPKMLLRKLVRKLEHCQYKALRAWLPYKSDREIEEYYTQSDWRRKTVGPALHSLDYFLRNRSTTTENHMKNTLFSKVKLTNFGHILRV